ncbi:hypothetical protein [Brevifollis gellanilyticus]|uniref:Uncharacterized protein n=1 Tax=Brevifollis gellanilyticus TaxID=748831 RepID=A0A512M3F1_9BACT|nr:hypothetical protein [Brevifollis gellanilyticus]GEP41275.1 hypothetical protein BGE01nite_05660 [Brevifollis gellanilyticus]
METNSEFRELAPNLWRKAYPLKMLGADLLRVVTIIRLQSGKLIIHSTAPFTHGDVAAIRALGEPGWLLDGILRHDTFAKEGRAAFPIIPYLAPPGFSEAVGFATEPIMPAPSEWSGEVLAHEIQGAPVARDTALLHVPSRTLVLTELVFNFDDHQPLWTELLLRVAIGGEHHPGMTRPFKAGIKDVEAFKDSMAEILGWDFDRVIVGHGEVIESDGKAKLRSALTAAGF